MKFQQFHNFLARGHGLNANRRLPRQPLQSLSRLSHGYFLERQHRGEESVRVHDAKVVDAAVRKGPDAGEGLLGGLGCAEDSHGCIHETAGRLGRIAHQLLQFRAHIRGQGGEAGGPALRPQPRQESGADTVVHRRPQAANQGLVHVLGQLHCPVRVQSLEYLSGSRTRSRLQQPEGIRKGNGPKGPGCLSGMEAEVFQDEGI